MSNTPVAVDEATATTALYLTIGAIRQFYLCEKHLRNGGFGLDKSVVQAKTHDLSGKTVGILGMGSIGSTYVNFIRPFGVKVLYHNRNPSPTAPKDATYVKDLYEMLGQVDILSIHMPLNANTKHFMGEKELKAMKKGSIIVNTARGGVIDQQALIKVLQDGHVS
jgi:glyoxylate reductase